VNPPCAQCGIPVQRPADSLCREHKAWYWKLRESWAKEWREDAARRGAEFDRKKEEEGDD